MQERLAAAIVKEAGRIGADPTDFATVMSFETGGTFDPWQKGPTTQWGVHRGLIQMGDARASGTPTETLLGSPAVDQLNSLARFTSGVMGLLYDGEEMTNGEFKAGVRVLPVPTNWVPFTAALGALIKD